MFKNDNWKKPNQIIPWTGGEHHLTSAQLCLSMPQIKRDEGCKLERRLSLSLSPFPTLSLSQTWSPM